MLCLRAEIGLVLPVEVQLYFMDRGALMYEYFEMGFGF